VIARVTRTEARGSDVAEGTTAEPVLHHVLEPAATVLERLDRRRDRGVEEAAEAEPRAARRVPLEDARPDLRADRHEPHLRRVASPLVEAAARHVGHADDVAIPVRQVPRIGDDVPHPLGRSVDLVGGADDGRHATRTVPLSHPRHQVARSARSATRTASRCPPAPSERAIAAAAVEPDVRRSSAWTRAGPRSIAPTM
jgi:hypothetical protein